MRTTSVLFRLVSGLTLLGASSVLVVCGTAELRLAPTWAPPASDIAAGVEAPSPPGMNTERYAYLAENDFQSVADHPRSTFSIDVDTASYSNVRRFLTAGQRPPVDAVRIEELVNYFSYAYPAPSGDAPFSVSSEVAPAPWNPEHWLVHIGVQGRELPREQIPGSNLVFLIDVSGSMADANKLPLLKQAFRLLAQQLDARDRVAIAVYAGDSGVALAPTAGDRREKILDAIDELDAGGSTNGAEGIRLAYDLAAEGFIAGGVNRVILATDGDFNVGVTSESELVRLIEKERERGVFLTVLGFGMYNLNDSTMERLADHGNGNYAYIDTLREAKKVLVEEVTSTLVTIAKDTKIQVEMNPARVAAYRLLGYENRLLRPEDFTDDRKDAGDLGAGHSVTAIYEVIPVGAEARAGAPTVAPLAYQSERVLRPEAARAELMTVKLRSKRPDGDTSSELAHVVAARGHRLEQSSDDFRFAAAVAGFGMLLRDSKHKGALGWDEVAALAQGALGHDAYGHRAQLLELVDAARRLE